MAQKLLGAPTTGGWGARAGGGVGGGLKIAKNKKTLFFAQKYCIRYTPQMFFEEYINFKSFLYLRRCGVISVQSFRVKNRNRFSLL